MIRRFILIAMFSSIAAVVTNAAEELTLDDGRKILLKDDGTWSFASSDRVLGTADGREVRVRPDGTWEYTGEMVIPPAAESGEVTVASSGDIILKLKELSIETATSSNHKNTRKKTQTVFLVSLVNTTSSTMEFTLDKTALRVEDSGGREYPILKISPAQVKLAPEGKVLVEVRADGSPHWFTIKAMELHFSEDALPAADEVVLKGLMSDARKRELQQD